MREGKLSRKTPGSKNFRAFVSEFVLKELGEGVEIVALDIQVILPALIESGNLGEILNHGNLSGVQGFVQQCNALLAG